MDASVIICVFIAAIAVAIGLPMLFRLRNQSRRDSAEFRAFAERYAKARFEEGKPITASRIETGRITAD